ncbi:MAG: 3-phosphoshikimate 1-carboxyvinyltransferase [Thermodesulfobacteriota bacterium]|nr:3-phosphoshikimate 1-carboxyvinyltransferase [Thermodesulfobacteriota bacterium]
MKNMKSIKTRKIQESTVNIPGSKSISHRVMICASLAGGKSEIKNLLQSEDISYTVSALKKMGAEIKEIQKGIFKVKGVNGKPQPCSSPIYLGNSGTSMRLLAGVAALGNSQYILTGDERMRQRPMGDLLNALAMAGVFAESEHGNNAPPVKIRGGQKKGGKVFLDCSKSSQYLSSLLMMGPFLKDGLVISLPSPAVSAPYIDLTIDIMKKFNVSAARINDLEYRVPGSQKYSSGAFTIEPDISNASYFFAAGAITGKMVRVANIVHNSLQGDLRFLDILAQMGCFIEFDANGVGVKGENLKSVDVDMSDIPDVVPTLAVIAAFARGTTVVRNIGHLREKECDRINAVVSQLNKMGVGADQGETWLSVKGGRPQGASIETFNDHRIAMAFSVAGLNVQGIEIENPGCVAKSFPSFWEIFNQL